MILRSASLIELDRIKNRELHDRLCTFLQLHLPEQTAVPADQLVHRIRRSADAARVRGVSSHLGLAQQICLELLAGSDFAQLQSVQAWFAAPRSSPEETLTAVTAAITRMWGGEPISARTGGTLCHRAGCELALRIPPPLRPVFTKTARAAVAEFSPFVSGSRVKDPNDALPAATSVDTTRIGFDDTHPLGRAIAEWKQVTSGDLNLAAEASRQLALASRSGPGPWRPLAVSIASSLSASRILDELDNRSELTENVARKLAAAQSGSGDRPVGVPGLDIPFQRALLTKDSAMAAAPAEDAMEKAKSQASRFEFAQALHTCAEAASGAADVNSLRLFAGDCLLALGVPLIAERLYGEAAADGSPETVASLAQIQALNGRLSEANAAMKGLIRNSQRALPYVVAGNLRLFADRTARAVDYFKYALQLDPSFSPAYAPLAAARLTLGSAEESALVATRGVENEPQDPVCLLILALAREQGGQFEEAAELASKAIDLAPANFRTHLALARAEVGAQRDLLRAEFHLRLAEYLSDGNPCQKFASNVRRELLTYLAPGLQSLAES